MTGVGLLKCPWDQTLTSLAGECTRSVHVMCPFVKSDALDVLLSRISPKVDVLFASRIVLGHFYRGVSDLAAFRTLLQRKASVLNAQRLHAKVYLFDEKVAIVTSGNLTMSGLRYNYEYGLLVREQSLVKQIAVDFRDLQADTEAVGKVSESALDHIDRMLRNMPTYVEAPSRELPVHEAEHELLVGETLAIANALGGWQRIVFEKLDQLPQFFSLSDVYQFEEQFRQHYPTNRHIPDAVRRELQVLRDRGLLEFLGNGRYRRLWR